MAEAPLDNSPLGVLERQVEAVRTKGSAELAGLLSARDGCDALLQQLPLVVPSVRMGDRDAQDVWDSCGAFYRVSGRFHEALAVNVKWYEQCLAYQGLTGPRIHKGTPLLWISECYGNLGHRARSKRYLMLATCEDALSNQGTIPPETTGVYFRLVWLHGMAHTELSRYAVTAFAKFCRVLDSVKSRFGIIFSRAGITGGEKRAQDAAREQLKVYQDRGMVIAVVTQADLERVAAGENFISMLRTKYEAVRLDLRPEARGPQRQATRRKTKGIRR